MAFKAGPDNSYTHITAALYLGAPLLSRRAIWELLHHNNNYFYKPALQPIDDPARLPLQETGEKVSSNKRLFDKISYELSKARISSQPIINQLHSLKTELEQNNTAYHTQADLYLQRKQKYENALNNKLQKYRTLKMAHKDKIISLVPELAPFGEEIFKRFLAGGTDIKNVPSDLRLIDLNHTQRVLLGAVDNARDYFKILHDPIIEIEQEEKEFIQANKEDFAKMHQDSKLSKKEVNQCLTQARDIEKRLQHLIQQLPQMIQSKIMPTAAPLSAPKTGFTKS